MIEKLKIKFEIEKPDAEFKSIMQLLSEVGDRVGRLIYEDEWDDMTCSQHDLLRLWKPPKISDSTLELKLIPYSWSDLQAQRQISPIGEYNISYENPMNYMLNPVVLTANAVIKSSDGKLIFHYKKKGARQGSIHTFGGYVSTEDLEAGGSIYSTLKRELSEEDELGLDPSKLELVQIFGTPQGMPSTLREFGTGAIYGLIKTSLTSNEIQERVYQISASESLNKELVLIDNLKELDHLFEENKIHPQTAKVLPVINSIFKADYGGLK